MEEFLSKQSMVKAIKANLFEYYDYLGHSPQAELRDTSELKWLITGIPHSFLNHVFRMQLPASDVDAKIGETLEYFHSKGIAEISWWVEPDSEPPDLNKQLLSHGLKYTDDEPGMACNLTGINEGMTIPPAFTVDWVRDSALLRQWVQVAIRGYNLPEACTQACIKLFAGLGFDLPLRSYIGFLKGLPVACSQLFLGAGVAGIYWVATVPEARKQGLGTALTLAALRQARELGYTVGILHPTKMGYKVYQGIGFHEYCRMSYFLATADSR